jgi:hypothetical protein
MELLTTQRHYCPVGAPKGLQPFLDVSGSWKANREGAVLASGSIPASRLLCPRFRIGRTFAALQVIDFLLRTFRSRLQRVLHGVSGIRLPGRPFSVCLETALEFLKQKLLPLLPRLSDVDIKFVAQIPEASGPRSRGRLEPPSEVPG